MKYKVISTFLFIGVMGFFILSSYKLDKKNEEFINRINSLSSDIVKEIQIVTIHYDRKKEVKSKYPYFQIKEKEVIEFVLESMKTSEVYLTNHRQTDDRLALLIVDKNDKIIVRAEIGTYDDKKFMDIGYFLNHTDSFKSELLYDYFNKIGILDGYEFKY